MKRLAARMVLVVVLMAHGGIARAQCCGDCNTDGTVAVNELVTAVNSALGGCSPLRFGLYDMIGAWRLTYSFSFGGVLAADYALTDVVVAEGEEWLIGTDAFGVGVLANVPPAGIGYSIGLLDVGSSICTMYLVDMIDVNHVEGVAYNVPRTPTGCGTDGTFYSAQGWRINGGGGRGGSDVTAAVESTAWRDVIREVVAW